MCCTGSTGAQTPRGDINTLSVLPESYGFCSDPYAHLHACPHTFPHTHLLHATLRTGLNTCAAPSN